LPLDLQAVNVHLVAARRATTDNTLTWD
jgi:hypothetical protein